MQYIKGVEAYHCPNETAVTLGKFDGLHRGHQKLIERVKKYAAADVKSVVFSFDMIPFFKEKGIQKKNLMTGEEKQRRLEGQVDYLLECPFTEDIYMMSAEDFIKNVLVDRLHVKYVIVGTDFHFGHNKKGDIHMLKEYETVYGYHLDVVEKEMYKEREISSTFIKEELEKGNTELAENLLGYPYTIVGRVEHGNQLGRKIGFPTMNVLPCKEKMLPPNGVYTANVTIGNKTYAGIGNIGCKPTVSNENITAVEVYVFDYEGEIYGQTIEIGLHAFVRPEQKFSSIEELKQRMSHDIEYGKHYFQKIR